MSNFLKRTKRAWEENIYDEIHGKKGGFFDLPKDKTCKDINHKPPTHIHIPQGKGYRHICPTCGNVIDLIPPQISL